MARVITHYVKRMGFLAFAALLSACVGYERDAYLAPVPADGWRLESRVADSVVTQTVVIGNDKGLIRARAAVLGSTGVAGPLVPLVPLSGSASSLVLNIYFVGDPSAVNLEKVKVTQPCGPSVSQDKDGQPVFAVVSTERSDKVLAAEIRIAVVGDAREISECTIKFDRSTEIGLKLIPDLRFEREYYSHWSSAP